jgi:hypothetical protein
VYFLLNGGELYRLPGGAGEPVLIQTRPTDFETDGVLAGLDDQYVYVYYKPQFDDAGDLDLPATNRISRISRADDSEEVLATWGPSDDPDVMGRARARTLHFLSDVVVLDDSIWFTPDEGKELYRIDASTPAQTPELLASRQCRSPVATSEGLYCGGDEDAGVVLLDSSGSPTPIGLDADVLAWSSTLSLGWQPSSAGADRVFVRNFLKARAPLLLLDDAQATPRSVVCPIGSVRHTAASETEAFYSDHTYSVSGKSRSCIFRAPL